MAAPSIEQEHEPAFDLIEIVTKVAKTNMVSILIQNDLWSKIFSAKWKLTFGGVQKLSLAYGANIFATTLFANILIFKKQNLLDFWVGQPVLLSELPLNFGEAKQDVCADGRFYGCISY